MLKSMAPWEGVKKGWGAGRDRGCPPNLLQQVPKRPPRRGTVQHVPTTFPEKPGAHLPLPTVPTKPWSGKALHARAPPEHSCCLKKAQSPLKVGPTAPHPCKDKPQELPTPPGTGSSHLSSLLFPARCLEWSAGSAAAGGGGKKTDGQRAVPSLGFFGESKRQREMLSVPRAAEAKAVQTPGHGKPLGSAQARQESDYSPVPKA